METNNVLIALLVLQIIPVINSEEFSNHVININSCCASQEIDGQCGECSKRIVRNISAMLAEHEQKQETLIQSLDIDLKMRDCQDIQRLGEMTTGIYKIYPKGTMGFVVRCDMDTTDGGWTVIQRRVSESDFYRTWNEYQVGFGNLSSNFWLGNQKIHTITEQGWYQLRIDLESMNGMVGYAEYNVFSVGDVDSGYKLTVDGYNGNAGDSLNKHKGQSFTTKDRDNDKHNSNCAVTQKGGWWFHSCDESNLNGQYGVKDETGIEWNVFKANDEPPIKSTSMKVRRWQSNVDDLLAFP